MNKREPTGVTPGGGSDTRVGMVFVSEQMARERATHGRLVAASNPEKGHQPAGLLPAAGNNVTSQWWGCLDVLSYWQVQIARESISKPEVARTASMTPNLNFQFRGCRKKRN